MGLWTEKSQESISPVKDDEHVAFPDEEGFTVKYVYRRDDVFGHTYEWSIRSSNGSKPILSGLSWIAGNSKTKGDVLARAKLEAQDELNRYYVALDVPNEIEESISVTVNRSERA
jgi:hypothetical protein